VKATLVLALPLILFLVISADLSWRPHTISTDGITVASVTFSPDGNWLAQEGSWKGTDNATRTGIRLWDTRTYQEVKFLPSSSGIVMSVAFASDGQTLAGRVHQSEDNDILLWDVPTGGIKHRLNVDNPVRAFALSFDGSKAAGAYPDAAVALWNTQHEEAQYIIHKPDRNDKLNDPVLSLSFNSMGNAVALACGSGVVELWSVPGKRRIYALNAHHRPVSAVTFSPDGTIIASASRDIHPSWAPPELFFSSKVKNAARFPTDNAVRLWSVQTGKLLRTLDTKEGNATSLAFSPDKVSVAAGFESGSIRIWDIGTGKPTRDLIGHEGEVNTIAFSPSGAVLASGAGKTLKVWRIL
jgi:WD40 repeat protein